MVGPDDIAAANKAGGGGAGNRPGFWSSEKGAVTIGGRKFQGYELRMNDEDVSKAGQDELLHKVEGNPLSRMEDGDKATVFPDGRIIHAPLSKNDDVVHEDIHQWAGYGDNYRGGINVVVGREKDGTHYGAVQTKMPITTAQQLAKVNSVIDALPTEYFHVEFKKPGGVYEGLAHAEGTKPEVMRWLNEYYNKLSLTDQVQKPQP
jgi:hypothetical protein